jgi:hypothetical protein
MDLNFREIGDMNSMTKKKLNKQYVCIRDQEVLLADLSGKIYSVLCFFFMYSFCTSVIVQMLTRLN